MIEAGEAGETRRAQCLSVLSLAALGFHQNSGLRRFGMQALAALALAGSWASVQRSQAFTGIVSLAEHQQLA